jgi:mRNA interferase MazF
MVIEQGDIFWIDLETGYRRPFVVVQNNLFNRSRIGTVVVCALTSNLKRAQAPGNVLLEEGEGNLPRQSVVNISQLFTVERGDLEEQIGSLSRQRAGQIVDGLRLLLEPRDIE